LQWREYEAERCGCGCLRGSWAFHGGWDDGKQRLWRHSAGGVAQRERREKLGAIVLPNGCVIFTECGGILVKVSILGDAD